jgi:hypothetical protein
MTPDDQANPGKKPTAAPTTIGFRLDTAPLAILVERAARLGASPHALAREYVVEALEQVVERNEVHQTLRSMLDQAARHSDNLALAVEALLCSAGKVSQDTAHAWIETNLK